MSTDSVAVAMDAPVEQPPIEEQLAAVGLDAEGNKAEDTNAEPILGKFQSVEDLAKAYSELEKKLGAGEAPATASEGDLKITPKEEAPEAEDMEALLKAGTITQDMYDTFVAGQEAASNAFQSEVYSAAGGEAAYTDLMDWASENLSDAEIDTFNELLGTGNVAAVKMAVSGLNAQRTAGQAQEPSREIAGGTPASADKFESWAQVTEAMSDPRYSKDPAFNAAVLAKLARSGL